MNAVRLYKIVLLVGFVFNVHVTIASNESITSNAISKKPLIASEDTIYLNQKTIYFNPIVDKKINYTACENSQYIQNLNFARTHETSALLRQNNLRNSHAASECDRSVLACCCILICCCMGVPHS